MSVLSRVSRPCAALLLSSLLALFFSTSLLGAATVTLVWDPSPSTNVAGYIVHYGASSRNYTNSVQTSTGLACTVTGLERGVTYYLAVSAYDTSGVESDLSDEISYTVPVAQPYVTGGMLGTLRNDYSGWAGMQIIVGANPLTVSQLGRFMASGNSGTHTVKLVRASDGTDVAGGSVAITMSGGTAGQFKYASLGSPVKLAASTAYWVLSQETAGGDRYYDWDTKVTTTGVATDNAAAWSTGPGDRNTYAVTNQAFVPVNFLYGTNSTISLTVQTSPSGGTFTVDGTNYSSAQTFNWIAGSSHTIATTSPQSGATGVQYVWSSWSDGGAMSHTVSPTSGTTYTATFKTQYYLTMNAGTGGTVSPSSGWYDAGQGVQITAYANSGYTFAGWTGSGSGSYSGVNNPATVTMNGPITETAACAPLATDPAYVTGVVPGTLRNDYSGWLGMQIVVGAKPLAVSQLGRFVASGNTGTHTVKLVRANDGTDVAGGSVSIAMTGGTAGQFKYGSLGSPVTLAASTAYWLLSQETAGGDRFYDWDTKVTTTGVAADNAVIWGTGLDEWGILALANQAFVPVNFLYGTNSTIPVTVQPSLSGGTFAVDGTNYSSARTFNWTAGSSHTIATPSPQSGATGVQYVWSSWSDGGAVSHTVSPTSGTTYTATFKTQYYLTMSAGTGGTVSPSSGWYDAGQGVQITAYTNSGYAFAGWTGSGSGSYSGVNNPATVTMNGPITETAAYAPLATDPAYVTGVVSGTLRNDYSGWAGMQIVVGASPLTVSQLGRFMASGNTGTHAVKLVKASDGTDVTGGSVSVAMNGGTAGQFKYARLGSPVTLAAGTAYWVLSQETAGGDRWYDWDTKVTTTGVAADNAIAWGTGPGAWNTYAVTNQAFVPVSFIYGTNSMISVTVQPSPSGATFAVDGTSYSSAQTLNWIAGSSHTIAASSPQSGGTGVQSVWTGWSDGGAMTHTVSPTSGTNYTAAFKTQYYLTMGSGTGGTVSPSGGWYDAGQSVQITASMNSGYAFTGWTGSGSGSYSGVNNPTNVTMNGPITETAAYAPLGAETAYVTGGVLGTLRNDYSGWAGMQIVVGAKPLTVSQLGRFKASRNSGTHTVKLVKASDGTDVAGGSVTIAMSDGTAGLFNYGSLASPVTLAAGTAYWVLSQETAGGDRWYDWDTKVTTTGVAADNAVVWGTGPGAWNTYAVTNQAFVPLSFMYRTNCTIPVTVQTGPSGGTFTVDGTNYSSAQTFTWLAGSSHTIATTSPQSGAAGVQSVWSSWSDGGAMSHTVSPTSGTNYTATFKTQYYLTLSAGTGGTVSPSSGWYDAGQGVQIAAYGNGGYAFAGWTGSGLGSYSGMNNPTNVTMSGPITETAMFAPLDTGTAYVTGGVLGTLRNDYSGWVGMQIVVGAKPLTVIQLGRFMTSGNSHTHTVKLVKASDGTDVAGGSVAIALSDGTPGQFKYGNLASPVTLAVGTAYWVLSQETAGGDRWYDWNSKITTTGVAADNAVVWGTGPGAWNTYAVSNQSFVPVDFTYAGSSGAGDPPSGMSSSPGDKSYSGAEKPIGANVTVFLGADLLRSKQIVLHLAGQPGRRYIVESSPDLVEWFPLGSAIIEGQVIDVQDTNALGSNQRFYRLSPAPKSARE